MQAILDGYGAGVTVVSVQISLGQSAGRGPARLPVGAERRAGRADGDQPGNGLRARVVNEAKGRAAEKKRAAARPIAPSDRPGASAEPTPSTPIRPVPPRAGRDPRERLYLDTMERVLAQVEKVIVDAKRGATRAAGAAGRFRRASAAAGQPTQPVPAQPHPAVHRRSSSRYRGRARHRAAANTLFTVDQRAQAIVLRFGRPLRVINAPGENNPGLKVKAPWESIVTPRQAQPGPRRRPGRDHRRRPGAADGRRLPALPHHQPGRLLYKPRRRRDGA